MIVSLVALLGSALAQDAPPAEVPPAEVPPGDDPSEPVARPAEPAEPTEPEPDPTGTVTPTRLGLDEGDPRPCFPIVVGTRRFRCGTNTGRVWGIVGTHPRLRQALSTYPDAKKSLVLADSFRIAGTAVNVGTAVVSGIVLYKVIRFYSGGAERLTISVGEVVVMVGGGIVGPAANQAAKIQLENAIDAYNLALRPTPQLGVAAGAVGGVDGAVVPTLGAQLRW